MYFSCNRPIHQLEKYNVLIDFLPENTQRNKYAGLLVGKLTLCRQLATLKNFEASTSMLVEKMFTSCHGQESVLRFYIHRDQASKKNGSVYFLLF